MGGTGRDKKTAICTHRMYAVVIFHYLVPIFVHKHDRAWGCIEVHSLFNVAINMRLHHQCFKRWEMFYFVEFWKCIDYTFHMRNKHQLYSQSLKLDWTFWESMEAVRFFNSI